MVHMVHMVYKTLALVVAIFFGLFVISCENQTDSVSTAKLPITLTLNVPFTDDPISGMDHYEFMPTVSREYIIGITNVNVNSDYAWMLYWMPNREVSGAEYILTCNNQSVPEEVCTQTLEANKYYLIRVDEYSGIDDNYQIMISLP